VCLLYNLNQLILFSFATTFLFSTFFFNDQNDAFTFKAPVGSTIVMVETIISQRKIPAVLL
jgi:hypothetical protein